jgi:hypothetical protein
VKCAKAERAKNAAIDQAKLRWNKVTVAWCATFGPGEPAMYVARTGSEKLLANTTMATAWARWRHPAARL